MSNQPDQDDPTIELEKLVALCTKHPEIGPPLAELAFKIGHAEIGNRVLRMGLDSETPGIEFYFVAAHVARREARHGDMLRTIVDALKAFGAAPEGTLAADDGTRLMHLVRAGFATLLFDRKDVNAEPWFGPAVTEALPALAPRIGTDPFYHCLLAQAFWFSDKARAEEEWERAVELGEPEMTWNARGTWYKEAEADLGKAEKAYRSGLEAAPQNALLLHNLAQLLMEKASRPEVDVSAAWRLTREIDNLLRAALRDEGMPRGLRRHVHTTKDRLQALRTSLPPEPRPERRPEPRPERRPDQRPERRPDQRPERGPDQRTERGPEQRAERPPEQRADRPPEQRPERRAEPKPAPPPQQPGDKFKASGKFSLGDLLLQRLAEKGNKG